MPTITTLQSGVSAVNYTITELLALGDDEYIRGVVPLLDGTFTIHCNSYNVDTSEQINTIYRLDLPSGEIIQSYTLQTTSYDIGTDVNTNYSSVAIDAYGKIAGYHMPDSEGDMSHVEFVTYDDQMFSSIIYPTSATPSSQNNLFITNESAAIFNDSANTEQTYCLALSSGELLFSLPIYKTYFIGVFAPNIAIVANYINEEQTIMQTSAFDTTGACIAVTPIDEALPIVKTSNSKTFSVYDENGYTNYMVECRQINDVNSDDPDAVFVIYQFTPEGFSEVRRVPVQVTGFEDVTLIGINDTASVLYVQYNNKIYHVNAITNTTTELMDYISNSTYSESDDPRYEYNYKLHFNKLLVISQYDNQYGEYGDIVQYTVINITEYTPSSASWPANRTLSEHLRYRVLGLI